jgi:hypothetical protein
VGGFQAAVHHPRSHRSLIEHDPLLHSGGDKGVRYIAPLGDLFLAPKLVAAQFDAGGEAAARAQFAGRDLEVVYRNPGRLDTGEYGVLLVTIDGVAAPLERAGASVRIGRGTFERLTAGAVRRMEVRLGL